MFWENLSSNGRAAVEELIRAEVARQITAANMDRKRVFIDIVDAVFQAREKQIEENAEQRAWGRLLSILPHLACKNCEK